MAEFDGKRELKAFAKTLKSRAAREAVRNMKISGVSPSLDRRWNKKLESVLKKKTKPKKSRRLSRKR